MKIKPIKKKYRDINIAVIEANIFLIKQMIKASKSEEEKQALYCRLESEKEWLKDTKKKLNETPSL